MKPNNQSGHYFTWPIWTTYLGLMLISVPWYWSADEQRLLFGFPLWVVISVLGGFLISCFTAWLLLKRWPIDDSEETD